MSSDGKPERVEVITGVQRRRRWTPEQKLAIAHFLADIEDSLKRDKLLTLKEIFGSTLRKFPFKFIRKFTSL
jgi:hypothetical protein